MKLYERIENNNFDEIDRNRAIELIEGGNGHLVYNENYFKLQKENEELKRENEELKVLEDDIQEKRIAYIDEPEFEENYISKKKVKDKIEEYKNMLKTCNKAKDIDRIKAINERILELQELIEREK